MGIFVIPFETTTEARLVQTDSAVRSQFLFAECARPRAQQLPTARTLRHFWPVSTVLHRCARGRAHSGPRPPPLTEDLHSTQKNSCTNRRFLLSFSRLLHSGRMEEQPAMGRRSAVGLCGCAPGFFLTWTARLLCILLLAWHPSLCSAAGSVLAWGSGPGTNIPPALTNVTAISAGSGHALALLTDGSVVSNARA